MNHLKKNLAARIATVKSELNARAISFSKPQVHVMSVKTGKPAKPDIKSPGFILVVVSKKNSKHGQELKELAAKNDLAGILAFEEKNNQFEKIQKAVSVSLQSAVDKTRWEQGRFRVTPSNIPTIAEIPVFAELRFNTKTVVSGLFADAKIEATTYKLPYNGGTIDPSGFSVVEYSRGEKFDIQTDVIIHPPSLSELETAMLGRITGDFGELNFGDSPFLWEGVLEALLTATAVEVTKHIVNWVAEADILEQAAVAIEELIEIAAITIFGYQFPISPIRPQITAATANLIEIAADGPVIEDPFRIAEELAKTNPQLGVRQLLAIRTAALLQNSKAN